MCFKKVWGFLWHSNSVLSWIVDLAIIFLIVKFVVFPVAGLIFSSSLPFVIVESTSMEHEGNLDSWFALHGTWYLNHSISKQEIKDYWPWKNGLNKGDVIVVQGLKKYDYKKGDVIIFKVQQQKTPIIHRIININATGNETIFSTKGDHNDGQLPYEPEVHKEQIIGKAIFQIPKLGWIKLFFVELFR